MTFSLIGRDDSGAIGMAVTSSSPCVAARCIHLRSGIGAVASQNITDPRLGGRLLDRLTAGDPADRALAAVVRDEPTAAYRQLCVLDADGRGAAHSGEHTLGRHAAVVADGAVAAGNLLANEGVVPAMITNWQSSTGDLEERLLAALRAGLEAGGEAGDVRSAGLAVVRDVGWAVTDLRVDWHDHPIDALTELLDIWLPQRDDYVRRGIDPASAPSFGVPGDE